MKEIKFRAFNVITKTMIDLKKVTPLALNMETDGLFIPFSDGLPVMQYTGLKDKNNKEIYEGDILKAYRRDDAGQKKAQKSEVTFLNGCYMAFNCTWHELYRLWQSDLEVIGNIYENPKLLTQKL